MKRSDDVCPPRSLAEAEWALRQADAKAIRAAEARHLGFLSLAWALRHDVEWLRAWAIRWDNAENGR